MTRMIAISDETYFKILRFQLDLYSERGIRYELKEIADLGLKLGLDDALSKLKGDAATIQKKLIEV